MSELSKRRTTKKRTFKKANYNKKKLTKRQGESNDNHLLSCQKGEPNENLRLCKKEYIFP